MSCQGGLGGCFSHASSDKHRFPFAAWLAASGAEVRPVATECAAGGLHALGLSPLLRGPSNAQAGW
jgi:hypothetical protein